MSVVFVPRSSWHPGPPTSNNGSTRPKLVRPVPTITRHYTGSPPDTKVAFWEPGDWMTWFQGVALASGKSFEYNYVIPPRSDGSAQVWEYAGDYQAAHSEGENAVAVGVLFAIGVTNHPSYGNYNPAKPTVWEPVNPAMIDAYRWLRDEYLNERGIVPSRVAEVEHRNMPGANTACPGNSVIGANPELSKPYEPPGGTVEYFTLKASPATLWQIVAPGVAVRVEPETWEARGNPPSGRVMGATEAATFVFLSGLPSASVK